eukprot:scaffold163844_cov42-Prasinocladus_malaysianus.AAC.1
MRLTSFIQYRHGCTGLVCPIDSWERGAVADIIYHHCDAAVANVGWDEAAEALLACSVPQLQPHRPVFKVHCLGQEIDPNGGLIVQRNRGRESRHTCSAQQKVVWVIVHSTSHFRGIWPTWYVLSNLSYMKRVMILVLPTLWSPRKTNLYFARGETVFPEDMPDFWTSGGFSFEARKRNRSSSAPGPPRPFRALLLVEATETD